MDDINDLLDNKQTPQQAATLKEMARKAQDRIRVYNPTIETFIVKWDGMGFPIPGKDDDRGNGKGQAIIHRYIARKYVKEMAEHLRGGQRIKAIFAENERRKTAGQLPMNNHEERLTFEANYRDDSPDFLTKLMPILWLGVEEEYGMDVTESDEQRRDPRDVRDQILANLERPAKPLEAAPDIDALVAPRTATNTEVPQPQQDQTVSAPQPPVDENKEDFLKSL